MSVEREEIAALLARRGYAAQTEAASRLRELPQGDALRLVASALDRSFRAQRRVERAVKQLGWLLGCVAVALVATQQFAAAFVLMLALVLFFCVPLPLLLRVWRLPLWINARAAALDLIERADRPAYCGALLDLAAVVESVPRGWKGSGLRGALETRLVRLLPRLEPEGAALLTDSQRAQLRRMLVRHRDYPDACIAILLALGTARDRAAQNEARLLVVNHPSDRVRAAARECLLSLGSVEKEF